MRHQSVCQMIGVELPVKAIHLYLDHWYLHQTAQGLAIKSGKGCIVGELFRLFDYHFSYQRCFGSRRDAFSNDSQRKNAPIAASCSELYPFVRLNI